MTNDATPFLALSLGTYCGWARADLGVRDQTAWGYGTWICNGTTSARLKTFRYYLDQQLVLGINKLFVHGRTGKMLAALTEVCTEHGISCQPLDIAQVRQFATNSDRADTVALVRPDQS